MQDFAGSTVVHLSGAMAALAGTLLLGPRLGKYDDDGRPVTIPGHNMPLAVLGVLILWVGWCGLQPRLDDGGHPRRSPTSPSRRTWPPQPAFSVRWG